VDGADATARRKPAQPLEHGNPAAGAILGLTLAFARGNIGNGPGWWVVVFSAGMSTLGDSKESGRRRQLIGPVPFSAFRVALA
jgi:hypothetical protein